MTATQLAPTVGQSAARPAPFPPIESYAFLSDCHTGALIAPDGSVEWLCVPSFDAPSIFGGLLDREAGGFRFGPYGIENPQAFSHLAMIEAAARIILAERLAELI